MLGELIRDDFPMLMLLPTPVDRCFPSIRYVPGTDILQSPNILLELFFLQLICDSLKAVMITVTPF